MSELVVKASIDCKCHNPVRVTWVKGKYYCKNCGEPLSIRLEGDPPKPPFKKKHSLSVFRINESLLEVQSRVLEDYETKLRVCESELENLRHERVFKDETIRQIVQNYRTKQEECIQLREELSNLREQYDDCSVERCKIRSDVIDKMRRSLIDKQSALEATTNDLIAAEAKVEKLSSELQKIKDAEAGYLKTVERQTQIIRDLRADVTNLKSKTEEYSIRNQELRDTINHLRKELNDRESVPIRNIVRTFLEHMTSVYNIACDRSDPSTLDLVKARTDYAVMLLRNCGLDICFHERGMPIGNGRMEIRTRVTEDPDEDCKVHRCNLFGCSFKDEVLPDIIEEVVVNRHESAAGTEEQVSDNPMMETDVASVQTASDQSVADSSMKEECMMPIGSQPACSSEISLVLYSPVRSLWSIFHRTVSEIIETDGRKESQP